MESMFELGFLDVSDMRWRTPTKTFRKGRLSDPLKTQRSILENGLGIGVSARHPYPYHHHHHAPYKGMHEVVVHNSGGGAER